MNPKQSKQRKEIGMYVAWAAVSLFFISLAHQLEHEWQQHLLAHIATEIGVALLVAIILAVTIDYVSKKRDERRFREEKEAIRNDVFEHVLGYRLPEGTFAELDNQILKASFIRRDFAVEYKLSPLEDMRFIKIDGKISYKIVNITPEPKVFDFVTGIEKAPIENLDDQVKFKVVNIRQEDSAEALFYLGNEDELTAALDRSSPNHLLIKKQIQIAGTTFASVTIRFEAVRAFEGGSSFILTPIQALGFNLKVEAWDQLEVLATAYLREALANGDEHLPAKNSYHWILRRPILPYQGVYLTWKSRPNPVTEPVEYRCNDLQ